MLSRLRRPWTMWCMPLCSIRVNHTGRRAQQLLPSLAQAMPTSAVLSTSLRTSSFQPARWMALITPGLGAYVLKLHAQGSAPIWCDALASGSVDAVAVLPDGRVLALVAMFPSTNSYGAGLNVEQGEALFRLGTEGAIEKDYFVGGVAFAGFGLNNNGVPRPHGYLAAVPGGDAPLRILIATTSGRIPAISSEER